jgi:glycerate kinase
VAVRIVIAPDKFKGFASARDVAERLASAMRRCAPHADLVLLPMADGGEGSLDVLGGDDAGLETHTVEDAWGDPVDAHILWIGSDAWIELAQTAGNGSRAGPAGALAASTFGSGMLLDRIRGATRVFVAIGGTLTSDGGTGLATALGWRFADGNDRDVPHGARGLSSIETILAPDERKSFACIGACDVMAPLLGERGAALRYASQKGADDECIGSIERGLEHLAGVVERELSRDVRDIPGAGAGGGTGAGLAAFLDAELSRGFDLIAAQVGLEDAVRSADAVVTGEGTFDEQSLDGKTTMGVLEVARRNDVPCALIAGRIETDPASAGFAGSALVEDGMESAVRRIMPAF